MVITTNTKIHNNTKKNNPKRLRLKMNRKKGINTCNFIKQLAEHLIFASARRSYIHWYWSSSSCIFFVSTRKVLSYHRMQRREIPYLALLSLQPITVSHLHDNNYNDVPTKLFSSDFFIATLLHLYVGITLGGRFLSDWHTFVCKWINYLRVVMNDDNQDLGACDCK